MTALTRVPTARGIDGSAPMDADLARDAALDAARALILASQELAPRPSVVEIAAGDIRVTIRREGRRHQPPRPESTECERDLLGLLAGSPVPLTTSRILTLLAQAGKLDRLYGEATVRRTLARLSKAGRVVPHTHAPRGYTLPQSPPQLSSA